MTCVRAANITIVARSSMKNIFGMPSAESVKVTVGLHPGVASWRWLGPVGEKVDKFFIPILVTYFQALTNSPCDVQVYISY